MGGNKKINWFDFKESKISGWGYLLRIFVANFLLILVIPGFWLIASTVYKRSRALDWSKELSIVVSVLMCILYPLNFVIDEIANTEGILFLITLPLRILHFVLLFKNGNKNIESYEYQGNNSNTDSKVSDQINNLEIIDKIVENSSTKQEVVSNFDDSNAFNTNIETSWGGEELKEDDNNKSIKTSSFSNQNQQKESSYTLEGTKNSSKDIEKFNYHYVSGNVKLKIFIEKCFDDNFYDKISFPGVLLSNVQKRDGQEYILPCGVWEGYSENGNLEFEVDFNILKPKSFWSKERAKTIDFDYSACEIRKYDDKKKLVSRESKSLLELKSTYLSHDSIAEIASYTPFKLLENIIEFGDFILPNVQRAIPEDLRSKYELIIEQRNWIQGFGCLYHRPEEGDLAQYIPFYFEDGEESFNSPNSGIPVSYTKSHVEIATFCEQDALKLINEIMLFNGGVKSFKAYSAEMPFDVEFRNQLIRINKTTPKVFDIPVSGNTMKADMVYIGIDLLPPKNITEMFQDTNKIRGIHPVSKHINNLLLGLDTPIFCFLDGGVADGRLNVIRDDTTRIILSINSDFDSTKFRNIIKCFSESNPILEMDDQKMKKLLDLSDLLNKENQTGTYTPNINFKKEDSVLSFVIGDKLLISLLKQSGYYQMRIDKKSDEEWEDLVINEDEQLEFYITETEESSFDSNFDEEVKQLFDSFDKRVSDFEDDDLPYWYNIIKARATSNVSQLERETPLDQQIAELIWGHADEYRNRLDDPEGDIYNMGEEYDDEEKIDFIKTRIIAFGTVFKYLSDLEAQIALLTAKYNISINPTKEKLDLELAHAKASLYGAIKYAKSIEIPNSDIYKWYSDFEDDEDLINGQDPFANIFQKYNFNDTEEDTPNNVENGILEDELGNNQRLISDYDKAIAIDPDDASAYNNRGYIKYELGDKKGAMSDYDKAIAINPDFAEAYFNRGNLKDDLGDKKGAVSDYLKAKSLGFDLPEEIDNLL